MRMQGDVLWQASLGGFAPAAVHLLPMPQERGPHPALPPSEHSSLYSLFTPAAEPAGQPRKRCQGTQGLRASHCSGTRTGGL